MISSLRLRRAEQILRQQAIESGDPHFLAALAWLQLASPSEPAGRQTFFSPHKGGSGLSPFPAHQEGLRPANSLSATCAVCSEAQPVSDRESGGCNVRHPAGLMAGDPRHQ